MFDGVKVSKVKFILHSDGNSTDAKTNPYYLKFTGTKKKQTSFFMEFFINCHNPTQHQPNLT